MLEVQQTFASRFKTAGGLVLRHIVRFLCGLDGYGKILGSVAGLGVGLLTLAYRRVWATKH